MEALVRGTLVLTDNCIRLERDKSLANYLLIWPPDFNISFENSAVEILNENDEYRGLDLGIRLKWVVGKYTHYRC